MSFDKRIQTWNHHCSEENEHHPSPQVSLFHFFFFLIYFIYLFLATLGLHCFRWAFSSSGERGLLFIVMRMLLIAVASLVGEHRLQACGLQQLWPMSLVAPRHVGSSSTRDQTRVPCSGRWILNHCVTREVPLVPFLVLYSCPLYSYS